MWDRSSDSPLSAYRDNKPCTTVLYTMVLPLLLVVVPVQALTAAPGR